MTRDNRIPANYQIVMPYLILKDAEKFLDFAKNVLGATETYKVMRDEHTIMHAEIMIGESTIMLADSTNAYDPQTAGLFIYVDNADDTYKRSIESGASIVTELSDQPYGRSGGIKDPTGNTWWITSLK
jgi:PhnB protein